MRTFLRDIKIKGVKNLKEPVELSFAKKEIKSFKNLKDSNVKAIYGPNGSGKTALVHAFTILKELLLHNNYLHDSLNTKKLATLMNKECRTIELGVNFFVDDENNKAVLIYSYTAVITYLKGSFYLSSEKYAYRANEYGAETVILLTKDGKIITKLPSEPIYDEFVNLFDKASFLSMINHRLVVNKNNEGIDNIAGKLYPFFHFANNIIPLLDLQDTSFAVYFKKPEDALQDMNDFSDYLQELDTFKENRFNFMRIREDDLPNYEADLAKQEEYLKIFKSNIKRLSFDKKLAATKDEHNYYLISEFVEYDNYRIDLALESVGIKKLLNLYEAIKALANGAILVIDELDSHINDVYLIRLLDYIANYTSGQLIFTTHNVSPMGLLKNKKHAIDFLSISGEITSWTQIGNYSASNMYHKGMIHKLPFNVSAESFIGVFADDK